QFWRAWNNHEDTETQSGEAEPKRARVVPSSRGGDYAVLEKTSNAFVSLCLCGVYFLPRVNRIPFRYASNSAFSTFLRMTVESSVFGLSITTTISLSCPSTRATSAAIASLSKLVPVPF